MVVGAGSPSFTNGSITGTTVGDALGIDLYSPGALTMSGTSITGNAGAPIATRTGVTLSGMTGMTYSGNGVSAIRYRSQAITTSETWNSYGLPYLPDSNLVIAAAAGPTLTLAAGVTVQFHANTYINVGDGTNPGKIVASGTSGSPILLTTDQGTVTPGYWYGLWMPSSLQSQLAYTIVEGAGKNVTQPAALRIWGGSPTFNHVTLRTNLSAGMVVGASNPSFTNGTITGTTATPGAGVDIYGGSPVIFNTSITGNLIGVRGGGGSPNITNCTISANTTGATSTAGTYLLKASLNYWGTSDGPNVGPGTGSGNGISGLAIYGPFLIAAPSPPQFMTAASLTETGQGGAWALASSSPGNWTLAIKDATQTVVRTLTASGSPASISWDGKNTGGSTLPDGTYTYQLDDVASGNAATTAVGRILLDHTLACTISSPAPTATLSNVYQNGAQTVPIVGTAVSAGLSAWILDYGSGAQPASWTTLAQGTTSVSNSTLTNWAFLSLPNGLYTVRLTLVDKLLNAAVNTITPTVGNFALSQDVLQFSAAAGGQISYTSVIPFSLTETVTLTPVSGGTPIVLLSQGRPAGTYVDTWNASASPDGAYRVTALVTDGTHSLSWDQSTQYINGFSAYNDGLSFSAYDPFNNQPLTFTYNFPQPGQVTIGVSPYTPVPNNCNPPNFCIYNRKFDASGPHTITWAGVDPTGVFRPDVKSVGIVTDQATFPKNAVIVYGRSPVVSNVHVAPPNYGPANGSQTVSFTLATYQSQAAAVTVSFLNQNSLSTLRTITIPSQAPGNVNVPWDGRAVDGLWVAPGPYTVTVTATDALGSVGSAQILTRLEY